MKRFNLICLLCTTLLATAHAQTPKKLPGDSVMHKASVYLVGKYYGDSVVLRWAPSDPMLWRAYNKVGYVLERMELVQNSTTKPPREKLNIAPLKPWTQEEWKQKAKPKDTLAAVAFTLLYGKSNIPVVKSDKRGKSTTVNIEEALNQKYDMENRFSMALFVADAHPFIANGLGLRFVDKTAKKGKLYLYSIHALTDPTKIKSDSAAVLVKTTTPAALPDMPEIRYTESDRKVAFKWNRTLASSNFTSYYYERSDDAGKTFKRRNYQPYMQPKATGDVLNNEIVLNDSLPQNYKQYYYRIVGITPFGDLGKPSPAMPVMGKDQTAPTPPQHVAAQHLGKKKVKITWEKPVKETDFAGFIVGRSESMNGPFVPLNLKLLAKDMIAFTDTAAVTWGTNYYVVSAIDTARNAGISIPAYVTMIDTVAPSKPLGLRGKIDTTGIARISWKLGKERDLMGYLVYFANAKDHTFNPLTKNFLADSVYTDSVSLNTLTEKIYYRIVAFDKNRNPSAYSDILELKKPDRIPPVAPVFISFQVSDTTVVLNWAPSSSSDATGQTLYRKEQGKEWVEVAKLPKEIARYADTKVKKTVWYEYSLITTDDDGNISERSFPVKARVYDSGVRRKIEGFVAKLENDKKSVGLNWKYATPGEYYFLIYRSYNGGGMEMYQQVPGDKFSLADKNLSKGNYEYAVKAVYKDGGQSPLSKNMRVEVK
ncbi:hypothetical protein [Chryseolinea lacunae]|uniref:Fibronectin type-III domain-containing protein n=1 Tax=Chryseolinea lacunae TaxID=2801331 RepID=A0ABS1KKY1_9BACT|nr:hypothetical protein [Chryseolinea lacunae]MBL0739903.1 hypothetical protein [Chryseolinea lacunae]